MKLTFKKPHLSIKSFEDQTLDSFTVITGLNGSGKSHLFDAIKQGAVLVDDLITEDIRLFDWMSFIPAEPTMQPAGHMARIASNIKNVFTKQGEIGRRDLLQLAVKYKLSPPYSTDIKKLVEISEPLFNDLTQNSYKDGTEFQQLRAAIDNASKHIMEQTGQQDPDVLTIASEELGLPIIALSVDDIHEELLAFTRETDAFSNSLASLFVNYRDFWFESLLRTARKDAGALSEEQFYQRFGPPPWIIMNQVCEKMGLDFKINAPDMGTQDPFVMFLSKPDGTSVNFGSLSSGEKILMSLAMAVYYSDDTRSKVKFPRLILLDEVDAPLHPAMIKQYISIIRDVFIQQHGMNVIIATHSASTIAMSPEASIFLIKKDVGKLEKTAKNVALNHLTQGVPTLSISFEGRRQVFVESPTDAEAYTKIYEVLKMELNSERSLSFIGTGIKSRYTGGHINAGCAVVKTIVNRLRKNGNISVFGFLDWDGQTSGTKFIHIMGYGIRNGLENLIYDPLLLSLALVMSDPENKSEIEMLKKETIESFVDLSMSSLQQIVDIVQKRVFGDDLSNEVVEVSYVGGQKLKIKKKYLECDDHHLEEMITNVFPKLAILNNPSGNLLRYFIDSVMLACPAFIPSGIKDDFGALLLQPDN